MKKITFFFSLLLCASSAGATEWHVFGARAMGMGGTGVALAQGAVGAYWNPAGLGQIENPSGLQIPVGGHIAVTGPVLEAANDIKQISDDCQTLAGGGVAGTCTQANIDATLAKMNQVGNGARADVSGGADLKIGKLTVFANNLTYVGVKPLAQISASNTPGTFVNNQSKLIVNGLSVIEIGVGYGHEISFLPGILVGGNLKALIGKTGYQQIALTTDDAGDGSFGKFNDGSTKQSVAPGVDVGVLWDINRTWESVPFRPRVGLTARNINNPKFKNTDLARANGEPEKYSLQGNLRAGAAISPLHFWNISADVDMTRNITALDGIASRMLGLGTEINVFNRTWLNIPLRAGVARNIAQEGSKTMLTGGFGLNFLHFVLDAGVMVSPSRIDTQSVGKSEKIPAEANAGVQLAFMFGGGEEEKN